MKKIPIEFEDIDFPSSMIMKIGSKNEPIKYRSIYTNGEFVTQEELGRIIRKKKIEKINNNNNEENS